MTNLIESILTSEFKFGFELEAFIDQKYFDEHYSLSDVQEPWSEEEYEDWEDNEDYDDEENKDYDEAEFFNDLKKYFSHFFGNNINIVEDGSIEIRKGGFEFPTPPMALTPLNIQKCIDFLDEIEHSKFGIYTNSDCGFHTHISFPSMTTEDMAWIICNIAVNDSYIKAFRYFNSESTNHIFPFINGYASADFLFNIKDAIKEQNWLKVTSLLNNEKYRLIRLHPQKTLEWRGPRNFLNKNNKKVIKEFFLHLVKNTKILSDIMDTKEINGISRTNFFKLVDISNIDINDAKTDEQIQKLIISLANHPLILTKLKYNSIKNWQDFFGKLNSYLVVNKNQDLLSWSIPLRYKDFLDKRVVGEFTLQCILFIKYITISFEELLNTPAWKNGEKALKLVTSLLTSSVLNNELLEAILKRWNGIDLTTVCKVINIRQHTNKSNNMFKNNSFLIQKIKNVLPRWMIDDCKKEYTEIYQEYFSQYFG